MAVRQVPTRLTRGDTAGVPIRKAQAGIAGYGHRFVLAWFGFAGLGS